MYLRKQGALGPLMLVDIQNEPKPEVCLSCSYETQKISCQGPRRSHVGKKLSMQERIIQSDQLLVLMMNSGVV